MSTATTTIDLQQNGRLALGSASGNPFAARVTNFRKIILEATTEEDMVIIARKLIEVAKEGTLSAIKLLFAYTIGKPGPAADELLHYSSAQEESQQNSVDARVETPMPQGLSEKAFSGSTFTGRDILSPTPNGVFDKAGEMRIVPEKTADAKQEPHKRHNEKRKRPK